jgi:hypothetical protein
LPALGRFIRSTARIFWSAANSISPNAFTVHGDVAPTFYLAKKGIGALGQTDASTRNFERTIANVMAVNPYTSMPDKLLVQMADQTGMKALHMFTTGDPARNATFVFFGDPNYFIVDFPPATCETCINPAFAWNHGDIQPEIANTWLGLVGPGVRSVGADGTIWSDHTDVRPTTLSLAGLTDSYIHDGRVLIEALHDWAVPQTLRAHRETLVRLGQVYKQLNAPFGDLTQASLAVSTVALTSNAAGDATYMALEQRIARWTTRRDELAAQVKALLDGASFAAQPLNEQQAKSLIDQAQALIDEAKSFAAALPG